jgi:hypothetical protein
MLILKVVMIKKGVSERAKYFFRFILAQAAETKARRAAA